MCMIYYSAYDIITEQPIEKSTNAAWLIPACNLLRFLKGNFEQPYEAVHEATCPKCMGLNLRTFFHRKRFLMSQLGWTKVIASITKILRISIEKKAEKTPIKISLFNALWL